jgi:hypothetical protein
MKSVFKNLVSVLAIAGLLTACAQEKNKKEKFARVSGGVYKVDQPKPTDKTIPTAEQGPQAPAGTSQQPADTSKKTDDTTNKPTADTTTETREVKQTAECRIIEQEKLPADSQEQSFCEALDVKTDTNGNILIEGRQLQTNFKAYEFKENEVVESSKEKKTVTVEHTFTKEETKKDEKHRLTLAYKLPSKLSTVDTNKEKMEVYINSKVTVPSEKIQVLKLVASDEVIVQVTDIDLFTNIEFRIRITYSLK